MYVSLGFHVPSIILADLLENTCLPARVQKVRVCDSWLVDFDPFCCLAFQGSLLCDRPVSGNNRLVKFATQLLLIFLIVVTCKNNATYTSFIRQKLHHHRDFLCYSWRARVILSQAGRARYIVIFINPAFTKMIDGKSLRSLQYSRRDTTNFAVIFIYVKQSIQKTDKWKYWFLRGGENRSTRRKNLSGARERTNNKLNSTYGVDARIRIRATLVGGRRLLSPLRRPCQFPQYQWSTDTKFFKDKRYEWRMSLYLVIKKTMKYGKYDSLLKNKRICY